MKNQVMFLNPRISFRTAVEVFAIYTNIGDLEQSQQSVVDMDGNGNPSLNKQAVLNSSIGHISSTLSWERIEPSA